MDAVKFLKERERMCLTYKACDGCPLQESGVCPNEGKNAEAIVKAVEKWSAEHPVKTRLMDFLEKHPNAPLGIEGFPWMRPVNMGYCNRRNCVGCDMQYSETSKLCWNLPLE